MFPDQLLVQEFNKRKAQQFRGEEWLPHRLVSGGEADFPESSLYTGLVPSCDHGPQVQNIWQEVGSQSVALE